MNQAAFAIIRTPEKIKVLATVLSLITALGTAAYGQSNSWKGLTPLVSSRADVERTLGTPNKAAPDALVFKIDGAKVYFTLSKGNCDHGWNVPKGTLLRIDREIESESRRTRTDLGIEEPAFIFIPEHIGGQGTWTNLDKGIGYHVTAELIDGLALDAIVFTPKISDDRVRCDGFPPYNPRAWYATEDTTAFPREPEMKYALSQFDAFLAAVMNSPASSKGYVIAYYDSKAPLASFRSRLDRIKYHILKRRKMDPKRIEIIEGGLRESSEIEFFIVPPQGIPPAPNPTLPSPQFKKKRLQRSSIISPAQTKVCVLKFNVTNGSR